VVEFAPLLLMLFLLLPPAADPYLQCRGQQVRQQPSLLRSRRHTGGPELSCWLQVGFGRGYPTPPPELLLLLLLLLHILLLLLLLPPHDNRQVPGAGDRWHLHRPGRQVIVEAHALPVAAVKQPQVKVAAAAAAAASTASSPSAAADGEQGLLRPDESKGVRPLQPLLEADKLQHLLISSRA